jgi:predicted enzyme related to lactoylglutathione lyase
MTEAKAAGIGSILWRDLTVADAARVRDFYTAVVGWESSPVDMGGYSDFNMMPPGSHEPLAGVCHARGSNADLPPVWLMYIVVQDVDRSAVECVRLGGRVVAGPRGMSGGRVCVIQDPAGATCALYGPPAA